MKAAFSNVHEKIERQARGFSEGQAEVAAQVEAVREVLAIPVRDIPTIDELLDQAKTDPAKRKLLSNTLAELEFASTEIEYP